MNKTNFWVRAYASVQGHGHLATGLPCQDAHAFAHSWGDWEIAIVCDGAGSAKHSEEGSDFVARNFLHCLDEVFQRKEWSSLPSAEEWRKESVQALRIVAQRLKNFAQEKGYNWGDVACTVVAAAYTPKGALYLHLGDGRGAYQTVGNEWKALFTPFRGEEANETVFITSAVWQDQESIDLYIGTGIIPEEIQSLTLMSDGCEKTTFEVNLYDEETKKYYDPNRPYPGFFNPNIKGLRKLAEEGKSQEEINQLWSQFLDKGIKMFEQEYDDKTLMLITRINMG